MTVYQVKGLNVIKVKNGATRMEESIIYFAASSKARAYARAKKLFTYTHFVLPMPGPKDLEQVLQGNQKRTRILTQGLANRL